MVGSRITNPINAKGKPWQGAADEEVVGAVRFELTTSCTRNKRATRLRYAPNQAGSKLAGNAPELQCVFHFEVGRHRA